jgi:hypothetical protein
VAEFKPSSKETADEKTLAEKEKEFQEHLKGFSEAMSSFPKQSAMQDVSMLLIKGYTGKVVRDYIRTKYSYDDFNSNREVFDSVLSKQGSLGKVFVEADRLPISTNNEKNISDFFTQYASGVKFVVVSPEGPFGKGPNYDKIHDVCCRMNKTLVPSINDIPQQAFAESLSEYPMAIQAKLAGMLEENPVKCLRLAFIQKELSQNAQPIMENKDVYNLRATLDNTVYTPPTRVEAFFTAAKVSHALDRGYTLSSIIKAGRSLNVTNEDMSDSIKGAFAKRGSVNKYQLDVQIELPKTVTVIATQKDVSRDMAKSLDVIPEFAMHSSSAPSDNMAQEYGLTVASLQVQDFVTAKNEIEIPSSGNFDIT